MHETTEILSPGSTSGFLSIAKFMYGVTFLKMFLILILFIPVELTNLKYTFVISFWYFIMYFVKGKISHVFAIKVLTETSY